MRYRFFSKRILTLFTVNIISALIGSEIAHRYWKPDLVSLKIFNFLKEDKNAKFRRGI